MADERPRSAVEITEVKEDENSDEREKLKAQSKETLTKFLNSRNLGNETMIQLPVDLANIELPKELSGMNISRISATSQTVRREFRVMRISSSSSSSSDSIIQSSSSESSSALSSAASSLSEQKLITSSSSFESAAAAAATTTSSHAHQMMTNRLQSIDETKEIQSSPYQTKVITLKNRVQMQHVRSENILRTKM